MSEQKQQKQRIIIRCECIDRHSLANLKLALVTARDTYEDVAIRFPELIAEARKIDNLINEFSKVKPCPEE